MLSSGDRASFVVIGNHMKIRMISADGFLSQDVYLDRQSPPKILRTFLCVPACDDNGNFVMDVTKRERFYEFTNEEEGIRVYREKLDRCI